MEIEKIVNEKMIEIIGSGFIEDKIKKQLEESISKIVNECLCPYSEFGKGLKTQITFALKTGNMSMSFPEYNALVCSWVKEIVTKNIIELGKEQIEKNLSDLFKPLEKTEWKLSEIIEKFVEIVKEGKEGESGEITFIKENDGSFLHIYFDEEEDKRKYDCKYSIMQYKDGEPSFYIDSTKLENIKMCDRFYGFDTFWFQLYATKPKVEMDIDNVETEYYYDND